ncbi:hypothetical protein BC936DRAFT_144785 [Jimgerdemannia flammicorona]|uniref:Uncharacterized protein n=1 Tax=Jimgerdemannia flammicorona TaxID=994334 RepID=A0A433DBR2_9FUNG|nr:hypothetical protein BC936DRAFT_144785 [Jimgerdemannia flammicorona]
MHVNQIASDVDGVDNRSVTTPLAIPLESIIQGDVTLASVCHVTRHLSDMHISLPTGGRPPRRRDIIAFVCPVWNRVRNIGFHPSGAPADVGDCGAQGRVLEMP